MIITKTVRSKKIRQVSWGRGYDTHEKHNEVQVKEVFWFLFIPVYTRSNIIKSQLFS